MNTFELFILIYSVLDAEWEDSHNESLGSFLSTMNPFLWEEEVSADNSVYESFQKYIGSIDITLENSFDIAKAYISSLSNECIEKSFGWISKEEWEEGAKSYICEEHKGGAARVI